MASHCHVIIITDYQWGRGGGNVAVEPSIKIGIRMS